MAIPSRSWLFPAAMVLALGCLFVPACFGQMSGDQAESIQALAAVQPPHSSIPQEPILRNGEPTFILTLEVGLVEVTNAGRLQPRLPEFLADLNRRLQGDVESGKPDPITGLFGNPEQQELAEHLLRELLAPAQSHLVGIQRERVPQQETRTLNFSRKLRNSVTLTSADMEDRVIEKLMAPVSFHSKDATLSQVLHELATQQKINIVVDLQRLQEEGWNGDVPVTMNVDGIQLRSLFNLMLRPLGLGFSVRDETIVITSEREARPMNGAAMARYHQRFPEGTTPDFFGSRVIVKSIRHRLGEVELRVRYESYDQLRKPAAPNEDSPWVISPETRQIRQAAIPVKMKPGACQVFAIPGVVDNGEGVPAMETAVTLMFIRADWDD